jgi:hypothetical protein
LFRDWQVEFVENFFHILPDPFAIIVGVVAKQACRVEGRHQFYSFVADTGDIFMEQASRKEKSREKLTAL